MAGAAIAAPYRVQKVFNVFYKGPIKSAEVVNHGDLGSLDSSGDIVAASKTQGATVKAMGVIFFDDEHGGASSRTGNAAGTVTASLAMGAVLTGINSTLVPSITPEDVLYLGPVPTSTVSNITGAASTTTSDLRQAVGSALSSTTALIWITPGDFKIQSTGNSTVAFI
jgi:hypothetical protein